MPAHFSDAYRKPSMLKQPLSIAWILLIGISISTHVSAEGYVRVSESAEAVRIDTDCLEAEIRKTGYVSGIARASLVDKKTGAASLGFGLHVMDFLMAPGWRNDGYERERRVHGDLPKHYVEGPQLCTKAKRLPIKVIRGQDFVAVKLKHTFTEAGAGYKAGSRWEQTLVFQPGRRYALTSEQITSTNSVDDLFYRIDMPGHVRHGGKLGRTFEQIYLSYRDKPIPAYEFASNFAPDERFLYRRGDAVPDRMIRAYRVSSDDGSCPWLAGMTLDPSAVAEAWCHQRGYVCFIQELHRRPVAAGETFGAAYVVGWFDDIPEMQRIYDQYKGAGRITIRNGAFSLDAWPEP